MPNEDKDFQSAHEIGRVYQSLVNKKILCDFFLESVFPFIGASQGYLFLRGTKDQIWLESNSGPVKECPVQIESQACVVLRGGKPVVKDGVLFVPLIVRNGVIGVACFSKDRGLSFDKKDIELAFDLASQLSGALKNVLLHEENLKIEKLAAVGETLSMVMHELKNIIQIAKLADELIRKGLKDHNERFLTHGLEGIAKALRDMDGFVWDMLSLSKDFTIEPHKINLRSLVDELKNDLDEKARELSIELDFQVEDSFPQVDADGRSLYRALLNMVQNSIEACDKDDSWVRIRAKSKDKDFYEIVVEDNGKGMTPEVKAKIFQAFFSTKGRKGNGLGLIILDRTCKAHQGSIRVESELGSGTKFTLTFPKNLSRSPN